MTFENIFTCLALYQEAREKGEMEAMEKISSFDSTGIKRNSKNNLHDVE